MMQSIVKLAIAALLANALWRTGSAYVVFYRFKDAVTEAAQYRKGKSEGEMRERVLDLASTYDLPIAPDAVSVQLDDNHTLVKGSYREPIDVLPGYQYPWPFAFDIETFTIVPVKIGDVISSP
jgi:hypothetical protein